MQGVGIVVPLFAGADTTVTSGTADIFHDPLGLNSSGELRASGSDSGTIRSIPVSGAPRSPRPSELPLEEASIRLAAADHRGGIRLGYRRGQSTTERFATQVLRAGGIETISTDQQVTAWTWVSFRGRPGNLIVG
jgi:hypothetical protein